MATSVSRNATTPGQIAGALKMARIIPSIDGETVGRLFEELGWDGETAKRFGMIARYRPGDFDSTVAQFESEEDHPLQERSGMTVLVRFDRVYGNLVCYPANQQAEVLARIAGTKTLLPRTLAGARALGLQVEEQHGTGQLANFLALGV